MNKNKRILIDVLMSPSYPELKDAGIKRKYTVIVEAHKNTKAGRKLTIILLSSFGLSLLIAYFLAEQGVEGGPLGYSMLATWFIPFLLGQYYISYKIVSPEVKRIISKET